MPGFEHRESVKHAAAKHTIANWFSGNEPWKVVSTYNTSTTSAFHKQVVSEEFIRCDSSETFVEAPLTGGMHGYVDELREYPTFEMMSSSGLGHVHAVADVLVSHEGQFNCIVEVCATNPVSDVKMDMIERRILVNDVPLIEVDADWIMKQSALCRPPVLKAKRIVLLTPNNGPSKVMTP